MKLFRLSIFSLVIGLAVAGCQNGKMSAEQRSLETAAVFSAIIEDKFASSTAPSLTIATKSSHYRSGPYPALLGDDFLERTTPAERVALLQEMYPGVDEDILHEFQKVFAKEATFDTSIPLRISRPYRLVSQPAPDENYVRFSQVAFGPTGTTAFVSLVYACAPLCASEDHFLLVKVNGVWQIKERFPGFRT
ncbi:MAG: hypothetical protein KF831_15305 [Acidobacteria bacterium]|nr:hypothetical protein [Acidobacteriota bacterium]